MLPKKQRIPRSLFKEITWPKDGFSNTELLSLRSIASNQTKISVSVSKKVSKKAVIRNRTRRRIYSSLKPIITSLEKRMYHITTKPKTDSLKGEKLNTELKKLLNKFLII